jgi:hypothetical protein
MQDCAKTEPGARDGTEPRRDGWRRWATTLLVLACCSDANADFKVVDVQPKLADQSLVLTGNIELGLNAKVEEALAKGIPLEVNIAVLLHRNRRFLWDREIASWTLHRRIQFHALSGQYLVSTSAPEPEYGESLLTLQEALKQLGSLNDVALKLEEAITPDAAHSVDVRVSLDIEALPTPLRPVAYTSFTWRLNSGWSTWKVAP